MSLYLYYLKVHMYNKDVVQTIGVKNICMIKQHYMPFFLTNHLTKCNKLGLYTKYIPCGAYICKLFDYTNKQCTASEIQFGKCGWSYSYIGTRYMNIFPFDELYKEDVCSLEEGKDDGTETCDTSSGLCMSAAAYIEGGKMKRSRKIKKSKIKRIGRRKSNRKGTRKNNIF